MPKEPLDACNIEPWINEDPNNPNSNSVLYNAMIHPLIRVSIKGALWYQGKTKITNSYDIFTDLFHTFFLRIFLSLSEKENKFLFGPKQDVFSVCQMRKKS